MKKLFFFAMLAAGMTAACQKPTVEVVEPDEPVAIQFGMKAPSVSVTKTKAAVDSWTTTDGNTQNIHVVGYNLHNSNLLWVKTGTPSGNETNGTVAIDFEEDLYYDVDLAYDFRAYYLGDDKSATTEPSLSVNFTITGEEDIMAGVTNRTADIQKAESGKTVAEYQMYSAYAARRGVHPSLTFSHMLTRLNVKIEYPTDRETENVPDDLQVALENLTVNTKTSGTLSLAGTPSVTFSGDATAKNITIDKENKGTIMIEPGLAEITFGYDLTATANSQTGQSITLKASNVSKTSGTSATTFEAGKQYNVTIKVYDLEEIEVSATLTAWGDGGEVTYDPDDNGWTPEGYTPQN